MIEKVTNMAEKDDFAVTVEDYNNSTLILGQ